MRSSGAPSTKGCGLCPVNSNPTVRLRTSLRLSASWFYERLDGDNWRNHGLLPENLQMKSPCLNIDWAHDLASVYRRSLDFFLS
jgi:hypothetical protein